MNIENDCKINELWPNILWAMINFSYMYMYVPLCYYKTVETNF